MARQVAMESALVVLLTTLMLVLAATFGPPGRPETPQAEAAGVQPPFSPVPAQSIRPLDREFLDQFR